MPPSFDNVAGVPATLPSTGVQAETGSGRKAGTGRYPVLQQGVLAIQAALEQIRDNLANPERLLEFQAEAGTGIVAVIIKDARSGQPIRQIPGNALMRLAELLTSADAGPPALVDLTA